MENFNSLKNTKKKISVQLPPKEGSGTDFSPASQFLDLKHDNPNYGVNWALSSQHADGTIEVLRLRGDLVEGSDLKPGVSMQALQIASSGPQQKLIQRTAEFFWWTMGLSGEQVTGALPSTLSPSKVRLTAAQQQIFADVTVQDIIFFIFPAQHKNAVLPGWDQAELQPNACQG